MQEQTPSGESALDQRGAGGAPAIEAWCELLLSQDAIGWFGEPITLSSGQRSSWYVNWRRVADDVYTLDKATDMLLATANALGLSPDVWYGVPEGATRLAVLAQYKWAKSSHKRPFAQGSHRLAMGRAKPKQHGPARDRDFLGYPDGDVVVLEDVTTTGGSLIATIEQLQRHEVNVVAAITMTDRSTIGPSDQRSPKDQLAALGVDFIAMTEATTLLPAAIKANPPGDAIMARLREEIPQLETLTQSQQETG